jgi:hypothetical protein
MGVLQTFCLGDLEPVSSQFLPPWLMRMILNFIISFIFFQWLFTEEHSLSFTSIWTPQIIALWADFNRFLWLSFMCSNYARFGQLSLLHAAPVSFWHAPSFFEASYPLLFFFFFFIARGFLQCMVTKWQTIYLPRSF